MWRRRIEDSVRSLTRGALYRCPTRASKSIPAESVDDGLSSAASAVLAGEIAEIVQRILETRDVDTGLPASAVALAEQDQILVVGRLLQSQVRPLADRPVRDPVSIHVMLDQPGSAFGDDIFQGFESRRDMIARIDPLADVVQQRGQ